MNKMRRKELQNVIDLLVEASSLLEHCKEEEEEALGNLPESLQMSEMAESMDNNCYVMDDCINDIECVVGSLEEMCEG